MSTPEEPPKPRESRPPLWWLRLTGRDRGSTEPEGAMPAGEPGPEKWPKETMPFVPVAASPEMAAEAAAEQAPTEVVERVEPEPDPSSGQDGPATVTAEADSGSPATGVSEAGPEAPEPASGQAPAGADALANGAVPPGDSAEPGLQDPGTQAGAAPASGNGHTPASTAPDVPGVSPAGASDGSTRDAESDLPPATDVAAASPAPAGADAVIAESPDADGGDGTDTAARPDASDVPARDVPAAGHVPPGSETRAADATAPDEPAPDATVPDATVPDATVPDATVPDVTGEPVVGRVLPYGTDVGIDVTGPTELDRPRLARAAEPMVRQQLSEWVEIAHRSRVPSLSGRQGSDGSDSISAAAVRAVARLACVYVRAQTDEQAVADQLMRSLISPPQMSPAQIMQRYPTPTVTISQGQIRLDLALRVEDDSTPHVELLQLPGQPELRAADLSVLAVPGSAGHPPDGGSTAEPEDCQRTSADAVSAEGKAPSTVAAGQRVQGTAAILWGPLSAIAAGNTYLSIETIMAYARTQAFDRIRDQRHTPEAAAVGMRAVRALEIVVLVSAKLNGALWIDVDPADGQPAAVTAIDFNIGHDSREMAARLV